MEQNSSAAAVTSADDPLLNWRRRAVMLMLRAFVLLSLPLGCVAALHQIRVERWADLTVTVTAISIALACLLSRRLDYRLRGAVIVGVFLLGSLYALGNFGLFGIGPAVLVISVALAVLLLGVRAALVVATLGALGIAVIFGSFIMGFVPYPDVTSRYNNDPRELLNNGLLILGLMALLIIMVGSLVKTLKSSMHTARDALSTLAQVNASLEASVESRTVELRQTSALLEAAQRLARVGGAGYDPASKTFVPSPARGR